MATVKKHVKAIIQLRRATEAEWIEVDPILRLAEPALSTDVYKLKVGDGQRHWSEIPYLNDAEFELVLSRIEELEQKNVIDCGTSTTVIQEVGYECH